jgi:hypothetical protein
MLLATNLTLLEWVLLATILACGGGVLWRTFGRPSGETPSSHNVEETERAQARAEGRIAHLEVRLHDFAREVEARLETRALQLDQLVVAGDREIVRLAALLNQMPETISTRQPDITHIDAASSAKPQAAAAAVFTSSVPPAGSISPAQVEMIGHLDEAGYNVAEIAQIIGRSPEVISSLLKKAA